MSAASATTRGCVLRLVGVPCALCGAIYFSQIRSELVELHPHYCIPEKQPYQETAPCPRPQQQPAGVCRGFVGSCGPCVGQFISCRSDQNWCSYIHITECHGHNLGTHPRTTWQLVSTENMPRHISTTTHGIFFQTTCGIH